MLVLVVDVYWLYWVVIWGLDVETIDLVVLYVVVSSLSRENVVFVRI